MIILILAAVAVITVAQAVLSSMLNRGGRHAISIFLLGLGVSLSWVLLSKYSSNLLRDSFIWDLIIVAVFTIVFILMGHGEHFTLEHWIAAVMTIVVFIYWSLLR